MYPVNHFKCTVSGTKVIMSSTSPTIHLPIIRVSSCKTETLIPIKGHFPHFSPPALATIIVPFCNANHIVAVFLLSPQCRIQM